MKSIEFQTSRAVSHPTKVFFLRVSAKHKFLSSECQKSEFSKKVKRHKFPMSEGGKDRGPPVAIQPFIFNFLKEELDRKNSDCAKNALASKHSILSCRIAKCEGSFYKARIAKARRERKA